MTHHSGAKKRQNPGFWVMRYKTCMRLCAATVLHKVRGRNVAVTPPGASPYKLVGMTLTCSLRLVAPARIRPLRLGHLLASMLKGSLAMYAADFLHGKTRCGDIVSAINARLPVEVGMGLRRIGAPRRSNRAIGERSGKCSSLVNGVCVAFEHGGILEAKGMA